MKKVLLFVGVVGMIAMTSCKKCEDCTLIGGVSQEYCGDELDVVKAAGWDCE